MPSPGSADIPQSFIHTLSLSDTEITESQLISFPAYKTWITTLTKSLNAQSSESHPYHFNPYRLHKITVQSVDRFSSSKIGFIKLNAEVRNNDGETLPGISFMRGGSVAMLLVLRVEGGKAQNGGADEEYVILTKQARVAAGTLSFVEIPAGMIDDSGTFSGAAAKEIEEETGLTIEEGELVDMTKLALCGYKDGEDGGGDEEVLQDAVYPSPGGSDEFIPIFLARKTMNERQIDDLKGKLTGLREQGEKITLKIVRLKDVWRIAGRDAKSLSAICLYENLKREGKI